MCSQTSHQELVIENCDKAIAIDPRYVKALLRRFKVHQALGHKEEALLGKTNLLKSDNVQYIIIYVQVYKGARSLFTCLCIYNVYIHGN